MFILKYLKRLLKYFKSIGIEKFPTTTGNSNQAFQNGRHYGLYMPMLTPFYTKLLQYCISYLVWDLFGVSLVEGGADFQH